MILFCLIILGFVHRLQYFPKKHVKHACLIWWTLISITLFLAWICTRLLQYNFLHAYDVHLSSKHFYMIDPPPKNWFRFTDVAKHNKVSNISCKKSGRRIMVGNLEITVKNGEDGWNSITIGTPYKDPTSQSSSKSVALLKILNWFMSWIKRLHSKEHSIVRKTWVLCKGLDLCHFQ